MPISPRQITIDPAALAAIASLCERGREGDARALLENPSSALLSVLTDAEISVLIPLVARLAGAEPHEIEFVESMVQITVATLDRTRSGT